MINTQIELVEKEEIINNITQKAILFDMHGTLVDKKNKINESLVTFIKALSKKYYICFFTAKYYKNDAEFKLDTQNIRYLADGVYYNNFYNSDKNDVAVKKKIYFDQIAQIYDIEFLIDNNKKVVKYFAKKGINTMRYKNGENNIYE